MCGVAGYILGDYSHAKEAFAFFEKLMLQSQIRGLHSTGVAWMEYNKLYNVATVGSAKKLMKDQWWGKLQRSIPVSLLLHCRYSTSGVVNLENAQPLCSEDYAITHNGLVSMENPEKLQADYQVSIQTTNDSEVILQKMHDGDYLPTNTAQRIADALVQIAQVEMPIFALGVMDRSGDLYVVHDHLRPLSIFYIPKWKMFGFASTKNIISRAAGIVGLDKDDIKYSKIPPYVVFKMNGTSVTREYVVNLRHTKEKRSTRPDLPAGSWLRNKELTVDGTKFTLDLTIGSEWDHRQHLRESFKLYSVAATATWEIDPNYPLLNYLFRRYELSLSQELWWCWLYGVFYHPGSVFFVAQEFPEYEKVDLDRLKAWHEKNWKALRYNKDRKYEKGHFVAMFESYRALIGSQDSGSQERFFAGLMVENKPEESFRNVHKQLMKLLRFGRYAVYIYTEALYRCTGMPILADNMFLKDASSPRAGLCMAIGKHDWVKGPLSAEQWALLETEATALMQELRQEYPTVPFDPWIMESCFCAYKGYFTRGRYLGYYLDRMADEIAQMQNEDITSGVDWKVLWQFRREHMPWEYLCEMQKPPYIGIRSVLRFILRDQGVMINLAPVQRRGLFK